MTSKTLATSLLRFKRPALILLVVWTLAGLSFGGIFVLIDIRNESPVTVMATNLARYYGWGVLSPMVYIFARRFDVLKPRARWRNVSFNLLLGAAISISYAVVFILIGRWFENGNSAEYGSLWSALQQQIPIATFYTVISFYLPTILTVHAILFFQNYLSEEAENAELRAELSEAQLSAMKMQLHPHFLFNSLHSISSLIPLDPIRANTMVALLGDFLRQTLEHSSEQFVTLKQEIEFSRLYLKIEETRFEDRLSVRFDVDREILSVEVPHLILQPLIENAVKHGIAPDPEPGQIVIRARRNDRKLILQIGNTLPSNNGGSDPTTQTMTGFGITNVRKRLEHIYNDAASLEIAERSPHGFEVNITIPLAARTTVEAARDLDI